MCCCCAKPDHHHDQQYILSASFLKKLTAYYTQEEVDALIPDLAGYYTQAEVDALLAGYYTEAQVNALLATYYTQAEVDALIAAVPTALIGEVRMWTSNVIPAGWLHCVGQSVSRTTYAALFAVIGTTFGDPGGNTHFKLPPVSRFPMSAHNTLGESVGTLGGANMMQLTVAHLPAHDHGTPRFLDGTPLGPANSQYDVPAQNGAISTGDWKTSLTGGGAGFNNRPAYIAFNFIIFAGV